MLARQTCCEARGTRPRFAWMEVAKQSRVCEVVVSEIVVHFAKAKSVIHQIALIKQRPRNTPRGIFPCGGNVSKASNGEVLAPGVWAALRK
jgi:hypothetical protein